MNKEFLEGSIVLEKLAEIDKVEEFFDAIDSDDFRKVRSLLKQAHLDLETIEQVLNQMANSEGP